MNVVITPYTTNVLSDGGRHFVICATHKSHAVATQTLRFSACGLYRNLSKRDCLNVPLTMIKCQHCRPFAIEYLVRKFQGKSGIKDLRILYDYLCEHHAGEDCASIMEEFLGIEA